MSRLLNNEDKRKDTFFASKIEPFADNVNIKDIQNGIISSIAELIGYD